MKPLLLWFKYLPRQADNALQAFRQHLAKPDAVLALSLLGLLAGVLAAITIIAFRLMVEHAQLGLFEMSRPGRFDSLSPELRLLAASAGGLLIGLLYRLTAESSHTVGILHILVRLTQHQGRLTWRNTLVQFIGGGVAMIAGHSVGREGPSAHLGAASSNLPAQALGLPHNSLRVLAACGAAAGIAASFNTPLAGALFATEVLLMEYTVASLTPIIMATVSATTLTRAVFGDTLAYDIPRLALGGLGEMPFILVCGVLIGLLSGGFNQLFYWVSTQSRGMPGWLRPTLAGVLVGLCGMLAPEIMGMGNDSVNNMLLGGYGLATLAVLLVLKVVATAGGIGLGLPGGLIGPVMFVGAAAGGLLHALGMLLGVTDPASAGIFTLLGMAAMMSGMIMVPMAGLVAILELSGEPHVILPGMLVVVSATITSGFFTGRESVYHKLLRARGFIYRNDPIAQSLRRIGVISVMERRIASLPRLANAAEIDAALAQEPQWIRIRLDDGKDMVLKAVDLAQARHNTQNDTRNDTRNDAAQDLLELPGDRRHTMPIDMRASLQEAHEKLGDNGDAVLLVKDQTVPGIPRILGVLTRETVDSSYRS